MAGTSTKLDLFFAAMNLKDMDTLSKSDPYVKLFALNAAGQRMNIGRTETVKNNLNPTFATHMEVTFMFEEKQEFEAVVYDDDGKGQQDDLLGKVRFQLAHVVGSRNSTLIAKLDTQGTLSVTGKEQCTTGRDRAGLQFRGHAMKKMDLIGKSDPYYILQRRQPNDSFVDLYKSKPIDNTLNPNWPPQPPVSVASLMGTDPDEKTLRFRCFDKDLMSDDEMGFFDLSFNEMVRASRDHLFFKLRNDKGKFFGDVEVVKCDVQHFPTFVELLGSGLQINLTVSIDFTGSNGNPQTPNSLHHMNPSTPNQYVRAIMSVGEILMEYDTDKQVPVFGFGASLPSGQVSHFFNVTLQDQPYVSGVQGILDAYGRCLPQVRLAGPTNFSPTIAAVEAASRQHKGVYTVLLILTDGEITDMDKTIAAIVKGDDAPLSIIIVGVGNGCDFAMMDTLDADGQRLSHNGRCMKRDIVQFVPFRQFDNSPSGALAAAVLREAPGQVVEWAINSGFARAVPVFAPAAVRA